MDWEKQYIQMILSAKNSFDYVNKFLQPYFPKYLYKYSACNSAYWKDRLYKGELYFCPSDKLNDPFDGAVRMNLKRASREGTKLNRDIKRILGISYKEKLELTDEEIEKILHDFRGDLRIASFAEMNDSASMWDRYADQHKGFCIEYDINKMSDLKKNMLFKVIYDESPDITEQVEEAYIGAGLSSIVFKKKEWDDEKEWRMFIVSKIGDLDRKYYFRKEIKSVYLGKECEEKNKEIIKEWAQQKNKEVYQMGVDYKEQKLYATRIN